MSPRPQRQPPPRRAPLEVEEAIALFDLLGAALMRVDVATGDVRLIGDRAPSFLGQPADQLISADRFWHQLVSAEDWKHLEGLLRSVAADGIARSHEHPIALPRRPEAWVRTSLLRGEHPHELLCAMTDVSASRHNERQWREVEAWLATLGEALPFDFWICTRDGRIVLQNPVSFQRMGNAIGRRAADLRLHSSEGWQRAIDRALVGEATREQLCEEVQGERRTFVRIVSPVRESDEVVGAVGVDIDVTSLKLAEERLSTSLLELGLARGALARREKLVALGEMAAGVAHEVRNPLGAIANATALLRKRTAAKDEPLHEIIDEEVRRLDGLVGALIEYARPLPLELKASSLAAVVDEAVESTLKAEGLSGVRLSRRVEPDLAPVEMDISLLKLAISNVVRNALQAMPAGGELRVSVDRHPREGREWARVILRDGGPGLPGAGSEPSARAPGISGRTFGLTIVRRVIDEHQGRLELRDEPGGGTSCVMLFPFAR